MGENGLEKYRMAKKGEQFKIVLLFMDYPVHTFTHTHTHTLFIEQLNKKTENRTKS